MNKPYKTYKKRNYPKKQYNNPYKNETTYYAYHDIFEHKDEIIHEQRVNDLRMFKYVISNESIKIGRVNAPGYPDGSRISIYKVPGCGSIDGVSMIVDNSENVVNEFAIAMHPQDVKLCGYDWSYDIVQVEVGGAF